MSRKAIRQYFITPRLAKGGIYPKILSSCVWSEKIPNVAIGKKAVITYVNGKWFANVKDKQIINATKTDNLSIVALDPGVRTFQTSFSPLESSSYGDKFVEDKLVPLMVKLDKLLSMRDLFYQQNRREQWVQNRLKWVEMG